MQGAQKIVQLHICFPSINLADILLNIYFFDVIFKTMS